MNRNKFEELEQQITDLSKRAKLQAWNEFIEELQVPSELVPALMTNRSQLIRLARPRALTPDETESLYKLIAALLETNMALREHASQLACMMQNWVGSIYGSVKQAGRIGRFAEFRHEEAMEDDE
jgi:Trp operon repressor